MDLNGQVLPYGTPIPVGAYNYSLAPAPLPQQPGQPGQPQQQGQPQAGAPAPLSAQQMAQAMAPTQPSGLAAMMQNRRMPNVPGMASGGSSSNEPLDDYETPIKGGLKPGLTKAKLEYILSGLADAEKHAEGGEVGHKPEFFSEGGLQSIENRYVNGEGDGTSDSVPAMLADGEFVIPADVVSSLGNGSNQAGSKVLDEFLRTIREHKRKADAKHLPPDSKGPLGYLTDAKRKVKN